jgi:hypothetical protein
MLVGRTSDPVELRHDKRPRRHLGPELLRGSAGRLLLALLGMPIATALHHPVWVKPKRCPLCPWFATPLRLPGGNSRRRHSKGSHNGSM